MTLDEVCLAKILEYGNGNRRCNVAGECESAEEEEAMAYLRKTDWVMIGYQVRRWTDGASLDLSLTSFFFLFYYYIRYYYWYTTGNAILLLD
jgi:hypothetical protein